MAEYKEEGGKRKSRSLCEKMICKDDVRTNGERERGLGILVAGKLPQFSVVYLNGCAMNISYLCFTRRSAKADQLQINTGEIFSDEFITNLLRTFSRGPAKHVANAIWVDRLGDEIR